MTGTGRAIEGGVPELPARRMDGTEFWVELLLSSLSKVAESEHLERVVSYLSRDPAAGRLATVDHAADR